jgi:hypothetical protein
VARPRLLQANKMGHRADPSSRQSHPNSLTEREPQALSSSDLSASVQQLNPQVFASEHRDRSLSRRAAVLATLGELVLLA